MAANVPAPLPELTTDDRALVAWTRRHPNATEANGANFNGRRNITDAGVAMLVQDRTCRVATVCRDIWQQLQSGDFAVRGGALLLVKQFILTPELTTIFLGNTGVTDAGAIALANKCPKLTKIGLSNTGVTVACKRQMRQVRAGLTVY